VKRICFLLCAFSLGLAQVDTVGITSYIEDFPEPGNDEGIYRQTPFVEMIHKELLEQCKDENFDQDTCPTFEWSVPFIPAELAMQKEDIIAGEWFRLETRTYWRAMLETGGVHPLLACTLGGLDLLWFMYSGELFFPASEFCDDFTPGLLPNCAFSCDLPPLTCPKARPDCAVCFEEGFARAMEHAMTVYYPEYQVAVEAQNLVLTGLGALWWGDPTLLNGSLIAPVTDPLSQRLWLEDIAITLIQPGLDIDPRAATYFTQTAVTNQTCQTNLVAGSTLGLIKLPDEQLGSEAPGLSELEELKRNMSDRESAGDTWQRTMLLFTNRDALSPQYAKGFVFGGENSKMGTSTPTGHACLGQTSFLQVFQQEEVVQSVGRLVQRPTACIVGVTLVPTLPAPITFTVPRWHTDWVSVPEGYDIPRVEGEPERVEP
jgi:hypothetical protein